MHHATHVSPSDNKSILGGLKSILGAFYVPSDNASRSQQQIRQQLAAGHTPQLTAAGHLSLATDQHSTQLATGHSWPQAATGHHRPISWPPQAVNRPKTQQNQGKITGFLREKQRLLMTLYPPIEKSIIQLFHYCIYPVILYKTTVILVKMAFFSRVREDPPLPIFFGPLFFCGRFGCFSVE
jgi:peptidoglycan/xylan/chitin deacetylase (PgdA/CDA1 family)